ncbi:MAG: hypothetical protein DVB25_09090 [Verrucomicrobia bacterium]|nr:MAG: hypothetical protein DVB25_09090 [Verrucomicrobiota bacterium]
MKPKPNPPEFLPAVKNAFQYVSFSSKKQADGASLERQLARTRKYSEDNNLILAKALTFTKFHELREDGNITSFQPLGASGTNPRALGHS